MNEIWQAALAEYGDGAFKLFCDSKGLVFDENGCIERELVGWGNVQLKPLDKLIQLDIEWAKAGVVVEANINGEWKEVYLQEFCDSEMEQSPLYYDENSIELFFLIADGDYKTAWVDKDNLRHPFPPLKELGL